MTQRPLVMRIITRLAGGGPPVHATLLNRHLVKHGFDSVLVFGDCASSEMNMEYLIAEGDRVERVSSLGANPNPASDLLALFELWRLMRRYRPAIVHTHTAKAGVLGRLAALLAGIPCVVHTYHGHVLEGYFGSFANWCLSQTERALAHASTALCTVSRQQADELSNRFLVASPDKFHVVPLGVDLTPFLSLPLPDFNAPVLTIGWLGRFVPIKNLPLLIEIATLAARQGLPLNFLVAGDGPDRPQVEEEIRDRHLPNIRLLPWQDKVDRVIEKCHLMILTSHREGTPLALIQGMASARPFLSTPAGGTVDLMTGTCKPTPKAWWYDNAVLSSANPDAFIEVLSVILANRDRLHSMAVASRSFAQASFDQPRLVGDIATLYQQLLAQQEAVSHPVVEHLL